MAAPEIGRDRDGLVRRLRIHAVLAPNAFAAQRRSARASIRFSAISAPYPRELTR